MTKNQKIVTEKYPNAHAEKYSTEGFGAYTYWLIWTNSIYSSNKKRLGEGETQAKAWADAVDTVSNY